MILFYIGAVAAKPRPVLSALLRKEFIVLIRRRHISLLQLLHDQDARN